MADGEWPIDRREQRTSDGRNVLYPILQSESDAVLHLAAAIARSRDAELVVGYLPGDTDEFVSETTHEVAKTVFRTNMDPAVSVPVTGHALEGADQAAAIRSAAETYDAGTVVMGTTTDDLHDSIASRFDGDLIVVTNEALLESVASILLPVGEDGPNDGAVAVAGALARSMGAAVEVVHVAPVDATTDGTANEAFEAAVSGLAGVDIVDTRVLAGDDVAERIGEESNYHDVTVLASSGGGSIRRRFFGSTTDDIREAARNTVVTVRGGW